MELIFIILWLGAGILSVGIMNHSFRYKHRCLYIKGYWFHQSLDEASKTEDSMDRFFDFITIFMGPIALFATIIFKSSIHHDIPYGLSYRFTPWTLEEALKEFPDDKELRSRASRVLNKESTSSTSTSYES